MAYTTIDDPSAYFQTTLYSGAGSTASVTNGGNSDLQPDWVWIKARNATRDHRLLDSTRGVQKELVSNNDAVEYTESTGLTAFQSDGFQHGGANGYGASGENYVAWQWKANGGTTTTNDASSTGVGGLDSVYQANTTAGFSIVTYTGSGSNTTVAHGLGNVPEVIIFKKRTDDTEDWLVYHHTQGNASAGKLNTNAAWETGSSSLFDSTTPTSSVFSIKTNSKVNDSSDTYVAYCFSEVQGYSKFGFYKGNGLDDGPFIYTGFKPAWMMLRRTDNARPWFIFDNKRSPRNVMKIRLKADSDAADDTSNDNRIDFVSNGFKIRDDALEMAADGGTYVYMAFAENPFVSSKGVPVTAR